MTRFIALWIFLLSTNAFSQTYHNQGNWVGSANALAACQSFANPLGYGCTSSNSISICSHAGTFYYTRTEVSPSDRNAYCFAVEDCPGDFIANASGKCEAPPEPDDECEQYQTWNAGQQQCIPDTPEPESGAPTPKQGVSSGSCDVQGQCELADWIKDGTTTKTNCGGWVCTVSSSNATEPVTCYTYPPDTELYCDYLPVYQGGGPYKTPTNPDDPPSSSPPPADSPSPVTTKVCPAGYTLAADGVTCQFVDPGTSSNLNNPGDPTRVTYTTCPAGYISDENGYCSSGEGGQTSCPPGFVLDNDKCISTSKLGDPSPVLPGGEGTGGGSCGGANQPPCKIDWGTPNDVEGPQLFELPEFEFDLSTLQPIDLGAPPAQCPPDVQLPRGIVWSWATTCSFAEWMRPIFLGAAWLFAGFIVLSGIPRD